MAKMKLALVQFQSVLGDVEASMARALPMIDEAAAAGANMVVFPELFTTGYHLDTVGPRMTELAEPIDGPTVRALQEAARKNHVYIVAPIALLHGLSGVPYNSAVFINSDGTVQGSFDKVHSVGARALLFPCWPRIPGVRHRIRQGRHYGVLRHGLPRGCAHVGAEGRRAHRVP